MKRLFMVVLLHVPLILSAQEKPAPLTIDDVVHAERLLGLTFTPAEQDSMLAGLEEQREDFAKLREVMLLNSVPPSVMFNPIPVGMKFETKQQPFKASKVKAQLPSNLDDLAFLSVGELGELIRTKRITSTHLTTLYLERLKRFGPKLECVVTLTEELALKQAAKADAEIAAGKYRGPLHGIPFGAKDLLSTKGIKTTWGAMPYKDQVFNEDATVIKRLEEAGAVLVAKLTMGALAWGDVWFGGIGRTKS